MRQHRIIKAKENPESAIYIRPGASFITGFIGAEYIYRNRFGIEFGTSVVEWIFGLGTSLYFGGPKNYFYGSFGVIWDEYYVQGPPGFEDISGTDFGLPLLFGYRTSFLKPIDVKIGVGYRFNENLDIEVFGDTHIIFEVNIGISLVAF